MHCGGADIGFQLGVLSSGCDSFLLAIRQDLT